MLATVPGCREQTHLSPKCGCGAPAAFDVDARAIVGEKLLHPRRQSTECTSTQADLRNWLLPRITLQASVKVRPCTSCLASVVKLMPGAAPEWQLTIQLSHAPAL